MTAWIVFVEPIPLEANGWALWMLLPLCLAVTIVYKTIRAKNLYRLLLQILASIGYVLGGLVLLAIAFWLVLTFLA